MAKKKHTEYVRDFAINPDQPLGMRKVKAALAKIWDEHSHRLTSSYVEDATKIYALSKNEDAKNFLRREVYALGSSLLNNNPDNWWMDDIVESRRLRKTTRTDALSHTFHALFLSIYEEDDQITRQERWTMARELEYAYRHLVPPEYLCGFIYQSGGRKDLLKKLEDGYIEPAFRDTSEED